MADKQLVKTIITQMQALYSKPRGIDVEEFLNVLGEELEKFGDEELQAAWHKLKTGHEYASYPRLPTFVTAIKEARKEKALQASREKAEAETRKILGERERKAWAWNQLRSDLGRRAASGDWALELLEFLEAHGRPPDEKETDAICAVAEERLRAREKSRRELEAGQGGDLNAALWRWFNLMVGRRERINAQAIS